MRFSFVTILSGCMLLQAQAYPEISEDCQNELDTAHENCRGNLSSLLQLACAFMREVQTYNETDGNIINHRNNVPRKPWSVPFVDTKDCCHRRCTLPELYEYC